MTKIVLIAHNIRSAHNVGNLMRTAEGLGIDKLYITGYSPYPKTKSDNRPPHIRHRISAKIDKTALGAQNTLNWQFTKDIRLIIDNLKTKNFVIAALEQADEAVFLPDYISYTNISIIVGNEVDGIDEQVMAMADIVIKIPMSGKKESFNVAEAAAMALYHIKYTTHTWTN